ncbi:Fc.00g100100.m01.CDS01 [Cosmosporella sp. VM-42]
MATIIATIVTLYPNDGHPIPQWLFKVSINALLAVYALTFKSAIVFVVSSCLGQLQWLWFSFDHALYDLSLYDDAGRGPTGSVRFLWAQHIRQPLASVGAVVMVASVAVGPFMQQLVRSSDCNTPIGDETATLPRTNVFDGSTPLGIGRGIETAVNSGILPKLSITSEWTYDDSRERWAIPDFSKKIELCKADFVWSNTQRQGVKIRILAGKTIFSENGWNQLDGQRITGCETIAPKDTWHCRGWGAATCDFQPCVRTYNASITAGILTEYLIDVSYPRLWGRQLEEDDLSLIDTKCTTEEQNSLLKQQGYAIDDKDIWIRYNISTSDSEVAYRRGPFVESLLDRGCLFIFSNNNLLFGLGAIPDNLVGNVTARLDSKEMESLSSWSTRNYYGPAALRHLYEYGQLDFNKIESTFANISESSTKYLRMNGAKAYSKPAVGQVMHYATCLKVQWTWIALPATLGALTLGLFLTVVATTEKHQIPVWKSSILPWIFRGPLTPKSGDSDDEGQGVDTTEAMNEKAKATIINLEGPSIRLAETQIQSDGSRSQLHVHVYGNMPEFSDPL